MILPISRAASLSGRRMSAWPWSAASLPEPNRGTGDRYSAAAWKVSASIRRSSRATRRPRRCPPAASADTAGGTVYTGLVALEEARRLLRGGGAVAAQLLVLLMCPDPGGHIAPVQAAVARTRSRRMDGGVHQLNRV